MTMNNVTRLRNISITTQPSNIGLQHLRNAVAAADHGSFRQAANTLLLRQSTLSRCIRQLEESIGIVVFKRSSGGVRPTPVGLEFLRSARFLMLAEEMKEVLGTAGFASAIEEIFTDETIKPRPVHDLLVKLAQKKFILTTNYDMLIENAFAFDRQRPRVYRYYEAHAIQRSLYKREFFILKAHGDAEMAAEKVILTERDYRNILYREPGYQSALQSIFTMYSVIFLGSSLDDPELRLLLNYINSAFPDGGIPHYALMSSDTMGATEQSRWRKDYNIQIIPISSANDYSDVDDFLKLLQAEEGKAIA